MRRITRHFLRRAAAGLLLLVSCLSVVGIPSQSAQASWLDDGRRAIEAVLGIKTQLPARDPLVDAHAMIAKLKVSPPALVLAASASAEGHWTFINQAGQHFTTASDAELGQVYSSLAPGIKGAPGPAVIYLTGQSVFAHGEHLGKLPAGARLRLIVGDRSYPLRSFGGGALRMWFGEVRANVLVRASDRAAFAETAWQLARPLARLEMRVLALDPAARDTFRPRRERTEGTHTIDAINPDKLVPALPTLRRQTAVLTGRLKGRDTLIYRTPAGSERALDLGPLRRTAAEADTNLVFVNASAPRQPGARNWLWLRVDVDGLLEALKRPALGDFFARLGGGDGQLFVEAGQGATPDRVVLSVIPMRAGVAEREPGTLSSVLAEVVSEVVGNVLPHAVRADMVSMARQMELDRRVISWIPAWLQYGFGLAILAGIAGLPVALRWWRRIWPREVQADYASPAGFIAARVIRWAVFGFVFLPLAGVPAVLAGIGRWIRRLGGRRAPKRDGLTPRRGAASVSRPGNS